MSNISSDFPTRQPAPKIGENGTWLEWDELTQAYVDTGRPSRGDSAGLSDAVKAALLTIAEKVAYIDENGQTYYDALYAALHPPTTLLSISAVFDQGQNVIYDTDTLDDLKQYLTITGSYDDGTNRNVTDYTLSGTLTAGTSTITVSWGGKTTTFNVTVTHATVQYTITNRLTNVVNSNSATKINENATYTANLVPSSGYKISDVQVVMGGTNITASSYSDGTITIASVTGDLTITAIAVEDTPVSGPDAWYDGVEYAFLDGVTNNAYINDVNGAVLSYDTWACCDFMNCDGASTIEQYGIKSNFAAWYKSDKSFLSRMDIKASNNTGYKKTIEVPENAVYFRCSWAVPGASSPATLPDGAYIIPHA